MASMMRERPKKEKTKSSKKHKQIENLDDEAVDHKDLLESTTQVPEKTKILVSQQSTEAPTSQELESNLTAASESQEIQNNLILEKVPDMAAVNQLDNELMQYPVEELECIASAPVLVGTESVQLQAQIVVDQVSDTTLVEEDCYESQVTTKQEITAFTESQILNLYKNPKLEAKEIVLAEFLEKEKTTTKCAFYELVLSYQMATTGLATANSVVQLCKNECQKLAKQLWSFTTESVTEDGDCADETLVTVTESHDTAEYVTELEISLRKELRKLRQTVFESHTQHSDRAKMLKLQIENYLQNVINEFHSLSTAGAVACHDCNKETVYFEHLNKVKVCISVLFAFVRRNIQDKQFNRELKVWTSELVAIVLRFASFSDHYFIIHHVLRSPAGIGDWAHRYIQVIPPIIERNRSVLGSPMLDHAVTVLSMILSPAEEREQFLVHYKEDTTSQDPDDVWVLIKENADEIYSDDHIWHQLNEEDIIQFLDQIPFDEIFKHVLLITGDATTEYDVSKTSSSAFMKLFAFCTRFLKVFCEGLRTYATPHFRGVTKRVGRLMRHMLQYVTEHWQAFTQHQLVQPCDQQEDNAMMERLQVEYDQFFERTVQAMYDSPRCGAWEFLADISYHSVSSNRLAKMAYDLQVGYARDALYRPEFSWLELLASVDGRERFCDHVKNLADSDAYFLMTALANMASFRNASEKEFIEIIVSNLLEVSFFQKGTREQLQKTGRDLLAAISSAHPFVISKILCIIRVKMEKIGCLCMYLFKFLDVVHWRMNDEDLNCLTYWILHMPTPSLENQFARSVLERLNWGFDQHHWVQPKQMHIKVALTLCKAYDVVSASMSTGNLITDGVKHVTSAIYSSSPQQCFKDWCWSMMTQLKLHQLDQPDPVVQRMLTDPSMILDNVGHVCTSPSLDLLKNLIVKKSTLPVFASLLLSTSGHSIPEICTDGLHSLKNLLEAGRLEAAITVLSLITPLFFYQHEDLTADPKFILIIGSILSTDDTYLNLAKSFVTKEKTNECQMLFAAMITTQCQSHKKYNMENPSPIICFWLHTLTTIPNWKTNISVLKLIDVLCELSVFDDVIKAHISNILIDQIKPRDQQRMLNGLSNLLNWVVSNNVDESKSLLVRYCNPDIPWLALFALLAETKLETPLWKALLSKLHTNQQLTLDAALKETCDFLEMDPVKASYLCIYRFGQQVLDTPFDHPAFPVALQCLMTLHVARVPISAENLQSACVSAKFYEGYVNQAFLQKIMTKVTQAFNYWNKTLAQTKKDQDTMDEDTHRDRMKFLTCLTETLNAMQHWLEGDTLYSNALYLPALPIYFMTHKLALVYEGNFDLWIEVIDKSLLDNNKQKLIILWRRHRSLLSSNLSSPIAKRRASGQRSGRTDTPTEAILRRLQEYDAPKPPPTLPSRLMNATHSKFNINSILFDVDRCTGITMERANCVLMWSKELCALDCVYMEQLPLLWNNIEKSKCVKVECKPPKSSKLTNCSGPASIWLTYMEKCRNQEASIKIDFNRSQHTTLLDQSLQSPSLRHCQASIQLELIVHQVCDWYKQNVAEGNQKLAESGVFYGRKLFYLLAGMITEDSSSYPPFKQLISSCMETLGQEFIHGHKDCQEDLARNVIELEHARGSLLSPHFSPLACGPIVYINLYKSLTPHAVNQPEKVFMLMSKFEMGMLLKNHCLDLEQQKELRKIICDSILGLMHNDKESLAICLELYRVHLHTLLVNNFNEHLPDTLAFLLEMSATISVDSCNIGSSLWYDFLNMISRGKIEFRPDMDIEKISKSIQDISHHSSIMQPQEVDDIIEYLSKHLTNIRLQNGLRGLYPMFKPFTKPIAILLAILSFSHIHNVNSSAVHNDVPIPVTKMWDVLEGLWLPWISPLGGDKKNSCPEWIREMTRDNLLLPWSTWDIAEPTFTTSAFVCCLHYFDTVVHKSNVLSKVLEYYSRSFATSGIEDHVLGVIHAQFSTLSWHTLRPKIKGIDIFSKIMNEYLPGCHSFIGNVFVRIPWDSIIQHSIQKQLNRSNEPELRLEAAKYHAHMLNILVRVASEPTVRQGSELRPLLEAAQGFDWDLLDIVNYESVLNWYVMSCDPRVILKLKTPPVLDVVVFRLMLAAAGYVPGRVHHHPDTHMKRCLIVRGIARLFVSISNRHRNLVKTDPDAFMDAFAIMLTHMEGTVLSAISPQRQAEEGWALASQLLAVIGNNKFSSPLQDLCTTSTQNWLLTHHTSLTFILPMISSICQGILQLQHRCPLLETALQTCVHHCKASQLAIPWQAMIDALWFPPTSPLPLLTFAAQENHLLVVYAYVKWRVDVKGVAVGDEGMMISYIMQTLCAARLDSSSEIGLILTIGEMLSLIRQEVSKKGGDRQCVWEHCSNLKEIFKTFGEDSSSTGLLAAIGLGRKSSISVKTRLFCRSMSVFIGYQLVTPAVFRFVDNKFDFFEPSQDREKALTEFHALGINSQYVGLKTAIGYVRDFTLEPEICITDIFDFFVNITSMLFSDVSEFEHIIAKRKTSKTTLTPYQNAELVA